MLDDLISKDDLKKQTEFYGSEIARLTEKIAESQNVGAAHQKQLDGIRSYIKQVNDTAEMDTNSTVIYGEMLKKVVVHEEGQTDFYLNCVLFGFRMIYTINFSKGHTKSKRHNLTEIRLCKHAYNRILLFSDDRAADAE